MYSLTFGNGTVIEILNGVIPVYEGNGDEQRGVLKFQVRAGSIEFKGLLSLISNPENTKQIIGTYNSEDDKKAPTESFSGYAEVVSIAYLKSSIPDVPSAFEWIYEVTLAEQTKAQRQARQVESLLDLVPDEDAGNYLTAFPEWSTMGEFDGVKYTGRFSAGTRVQYKGTAYKCISAHDIDPRQTDWNPVDAVSLWTRIGNPNEEWPEWFQPQGAHDAYAKDSKVSRNGKRWTSTADANVWEPGVYGWTEAK